MLLNNKLNEVPEEIKLFCDEMQAENTATQSSGVGCEKPAKPTSGGNQCFPELRLVLLGLYKSGKSSTGNTILGSDKFGEWTDRYQKEEAEVAGRRLVVVDTPPLQKASVVSPDQNIVTWVCQCPPGPHALVFVLNLSSSFTSLQLTFVQRYMELLGEQAWEHLVVVFTGADVLDGMDMASFLRNKDVSLQMFLDKCGNRHYLFNNRTRRYSTQVTDLLEGIERLSSQRSPGFYEIDKAVATNMEEMNLALIERAQKRAQKVAAKERAQQVIFREGIAHRLTEVRIVLLGEKRSGKTTAAKTMAKLFFEEDKNKCVATRTIIDDRTVLVVDTPGWSIHTRRGSSQKQDTIKEALSLCHPGPHAFLIAVNLRNSFTEKHRAALEHNLACLSDTMWKNAIVLFTFGERLRGETVETYIENQGEDLKWLVKQCDKRYHVFSDTQFKDLPQVRELLKKIDGMVEANSGQYFSDILSQIHSETPSSERSDPLDVEDDDFEYTPREKRMMEKMKKEIRERLLVDILSYISTPMKAASLSLPPNSKVTS
uniref:AIG1-type G domain-containing protein n=1 Tax=Stegastes partitus TaxID=144197 RepID=A0A3B5A8R4_9TELE